MRRIISKLLPHPLLTVTLVTVWMLLLNAFSVGGLLIAIVLGVAIPMATSRYWPGAPRIRLGWRAVAYALIVIWDIVVANVQVAYLILFRRADRLRSTWITVPLALRAPEAITALAGTITLTPGTVSCDVADDGSALLVHCLHEPDPELAVARIKGRYEARLKEIFE